MIRLRKSEQDMSGIGGSVETYVIDGSVILFGGNNIKIPVFVLKHPLEEMKKPFLGKKRFIK